MNSAVTEPPPSNEIVRKFFNRKREKNPAFSLRLLATQIGVSPAYLSRILNGHKPLPTHLLGELVQRLEIDDTAAQQLKNGLIIERDLSAETKALLKDIGSVDLERNPASSEFAEMPDRYFVLLEEWYYLPILDLTTCVEFNADPTWIAARLGLRVSVAESAWQRLIRLGCVQLEKSQWKKCADKIRFPTARTQPLVRNFHKTILKKAADELNNIDANSFSERFIKGGSVATTHDHIQPALQLLDEALFNAMAVLSEGECTEVYNVSIQLFPLTKES